jgi:hypothetical protein
LVLKRLHIAFGETNLLFVGNVACLVYSDIVSSKVPHDILRISILIGYTFIWLLEAFLPKLDKRILDWFAGKEVND